jgi:hypothetical protein
MGKSESPITFDVKRSVIFMWLKTDPGILQLFSEMARG